MPHAYTGLRAGLAMTGAMRKLQVFDLSAPTVIGVSYIWL
jgi:hypothetical protein